MKVWLLRAVMAAMRRACPTRLTALCARPGKGLPPLILVPGATPSQEQKCLGGREGGEVRADLGSDRQGDTGADGRDRGKVDAHHTVQGHGQGLVVHGMLAASAAVRSGFRGRAGRSRGWRFVGRGIVCGIVRRRQIRRSAPAIRASQSSICCSKKS